MFATIYRSLIMAAFAALTLTLSIAAQSGRVQPTPTPVPEEEPVRVDTEEIKVNVLAFDEMGRFVMDVTEADLVITDNDILHQASSVRRIPANVLIVMDTGGELRVKKNLDQTRRTALGVVATLHPDDLIAVLQYADDAEIIAEWTNDRGVLREAIGRTQFGRRSAFAKALGLATDVLLSTPQDNRHLVLITDGTDSFEDAYGVSMAMRRLLSTDINVHVLSYTRMESADIEPRTKAITNTPPPRALPDEVAATLPNGARDVARAPKIGPTVIVDRKHLELMRKRKADLEQSEIALSELADNTNGTIIIPLDNEEMLAKTADIARFINSSYVLTYTPKVSLVENPGPRTIFVTSKRPGLIVEARRRLVAEKTKR
jgi:Mg-chelatase subunit ChlD